MYAVVEAFSGKIRGKYKSQLEAMAIADKLLLEEMELFIVSRV